MLNTEEMGKRIKELRIEKGWTGIKMSKQEQTNRIIRKSKKENTKSNQKNYMKLQIYSMFHQII